ncbi:MAG TPA: LptF/LptG family permease [Blastocatellia bacterium]|nr:LptF/LptG family permease [Blastocatellia bacterium]
MKWRMFWHTVKEVIPLVCLLFLILTTLVFAQQIGKYSSLILSFQSSTEITQKLLLSLIPGIAVITLPVSLLLGTVIACSRSSSDNEMTAWQSLGISQRALASPFLAIGLAGTIGAAYLSAYVAPAALRTQKSLITQIMLQEANTRIKPHTFITNFPHLLLYVQNVDPHTHDWLGVFLLQNEPDGTFRLLTAERGQFRIESGQSLALEAQLLNGVSLQYGSQASTDSGRLIPPPSQSAALFAKSTVKLVDNPNTTDGADRDPGSGRLNLMSLQEMSKMSLQEISKFAKEAKTDEERRQAEAEMHRRFAFPFACLTLTAMTFILAVRGRRFSTRPRTVIAVLIMAMGFYFLLVMGQNLSLKGAVPVWLGVWFSNLVYGAVILKSLASSKATWSSLLSLIKPPSASGVAGDSRYTQAPASEDRPAAPRPSRGFRVRSLNLINYLLISEIVKYFALAVSALVATSTIFTLFDLIPAIVKSGTPVPYAASYLAYLAPQLFYYAAPFALLVALLLSFNVLSRSNQLVVIAGAGQNRMRTINAILVTAGAMSLALWALSNYVLPHTNREQDARYNRIKGRQVEQTTIAFGRKWVFDKNDAIYGYQRVDPDNSLINTSIYRLDGDRGLIRSAMHFGLATQVGPSTWKADSGWIETITPDSTIERRAIQSRPEVINVSEGAGLFKRTTNESSKMSVAQLRAHVTQLKILGVPTLDLQIDLRRRAAFPLSCLVLSILAIPFITAKQARRSGPLVSVSLSVGIGLVFWLLTTLFEAVGKQNNLPVGMAVWGPHILFVAVGLYLNFVRYRLQ